MSWQAGGMIVGAVAVAYGLAVAFLAERMDENLRGKFVMGGALVVLALTVFLFLLPIAGVY